MKKLLITFLAVMCCMMMNAEEFTVGGIKYKVTGANTVEVVVNSPEYSGSVVIPATVTDTNTGTTYNVTRIGEEAFKLCWDLTSVTIPESVTNIGMDAFRSCENLASISIPESVTSIGMNAFMSCEKLTSISIPESVTSIGMDAFSDTGWYSSQPDGLLYLCNCLLGYKNINNPPTGDLEIADGTRLIADNALQFSWDLTSVTIPASVKSIGMDAFKSCTSLISVTIPESVTSMVDNPFTWCSELASITVDSKNAVYDSRDNCHAIIETATNTLISGCQNTIVPSSVKSIGNSAFEGCEGLTSVTIPSGVTSIGNRAFGRCKGLTSIIVFATNPPKVGVDAFYDWDDRIINNVLVFVPDVEKYTGWGNFKNLRTILTKDEAIAELRDFIENRVGVTIDDYITAINNAETVLDINEILTNAVAEINNMTYATIGDIMYYLGDEKTIDGEIRFYDKDFYSSDYDFTVTGKITYSRTFKDNNWQALYVPFAISYSDWSNNFDVAAINNFHEYTDDMGQTVKTELEVRLVKDRTLKPNHPYLIRAKRADKNNPQTINISSKKMYESEENSIVCSSVERKYTFTGTYRDITGMRTDDYIFMSGGKLCKAVDDGVKLSAQRWYLSIESLGSQFDDGDPSYARAMEFDIKLLNDEATGIDEITVTRTPLTDDSETIYNLNGMRVSDSYKGIVIKNGKKIYQW